MILEGVSWLVFAGCCEGEHLLASDIGRTNERVYPARRTDSHPPTESVAFASRYDIAGQFGGTIRCL
jgi:hypothetical protein